MLIKTHSPRGPRLTAMATVGGVRPKLRGTEVCCGMLLCRIVLGGSGVLGLRGLVLGDDDNLVEEFVVYEDGSV